jgi:ribose 5-phosphate isomerase B
MRIAVGCDHRGLKLKQQVLEILTAAGHSYNDVGCYSEEPVDYPDIARYVAVTVADEKCDMGIVICSTGIGVSIAANKVKGIRAALCCDTFSAQRSRQHNDANVMCLSAGIKEPLLKEMIPAFLEGKFEGGRHQRRVEKITAMEQACG